ncbi:hypothetical protein PG984_013011 [Apiospora sp. TS-2023a]
MCDVYSDAYLVLAAASADRDDKGFGKLDILLQQVIPHSDPLDYPAPESPISLGPLGKLTWTLQETILARRCIRYNQSEVAWECHSTIACERSQSPGFPFSGIQRKHDEKVKWRYKNGTGLGDGLISNSHSRPLGQSDDIAATSMEWRELIVTNYTRRGLTVPSDRLPALSGIASIIGKSSRDQYLAGIWPRDIIGHGLAWKALNNFFLLQGPTPATPAGPSFSWVSVDAPITYTLPSLERRYGGPRYGYVAVDLLDCGISLSGHIIYGSVQGGWLKLSARSHTLQLQWCTGHMENKHTGNRCIEWRLGGLFRSRTLYRDNAIATLPLQTYPTEHRVWSAGDTMRYWDRRVSVTGSIRGQ